MIDQSIDRSAGHLTAHLAHVRHAASQAQAAANGRAAAATAAAASAALLLHRLLANVPAGD